MLPRRTWPVARLPGQAVMASEIHARILLCPARVGPRGLRGRAPDPPCCLYRRGIRACSRAFRARSACGPGRLRTRCVSLAGPPEIRRPVSVLRGVQSLSLMMYRLWQRTADTGGADEARHPNAQSHVKMDGRRGGKFDSAPAGAPAAYQAYSRTRHLT